MTQQEIQERNTQIALMLGWEYDEDLKIFNTPFLELVEPQAFGDEQFSSRLHDYELKFHSDWNWLMEAVEFIETIKVNNIQIYDVKIWDSHCEIKMNPQYALTFDKLPEPNWIIQKTKIEAVFIAVSYFAKLYNNKEL
jgi:hypothetical protein